MSRNWSLYRPAVRTERSEKMKNVEGILASASGCSFVLRFVFVVCREGCAGAVLGSGSAST